MPLRLSNMVIVSSDETLEEKRFFGKYCVSVELGL